MGAKPVAPHTSEQFKDYETFRDWLYASFADGASNAERGTSFCDFVISLLPETARGRRFGLLKPARKLSHDRGVDAVNADDDHPDPVAVQSKLTIGEKSDLDGVFSKWQAYEAELIAQGPLELLPVEGDGPRLPTYVLATSKRLKNLLELYDATEFGSRPFYRKLTAEHRLLIWDGQDLLDDARQVETRRFETPLEVELVSEKGWLELGRVRIGVLQARDLVLLEEKHGPGLFFENVRGWKGLDPVKDGETVNEAIRDTVANAPAEMLARNNGVTFRAASVTADGNRLVLAGGSIVNGRQTTGCISAAGPRVSPDCLVQVKVVESPGDAWRIAEAANNQNAVARIDLRLARYFREQLVQRELATTTIGADWVHHVIEGLRDREATFDQLRYLFIGLFCKRPNQLANDNYSHIEFDVLAGLFANGDPPPELYPTLFEVVKATNEALDELVDLGEQDPLRNLHVNHRPKYRAYLGLLTLCATHKINLSEELATVDAEVERVSQWVSQTKTLLEGVGRQRFGANLISTYEVLGMLALAADDEGGGLKVQQRLADTIFSRGFATVYRQVQNKIAVEQRKVELRRSHGTQP